MKAIVAHAVVLVLVLSSSVLASYQTREINSAYVEEHPEEFSVRVSEQADELILFTVTYNILQPRYVVSHLNVNDGTKTYATSVTPLFTKNRTNTLHFTVPRNLIATSTFSLSVGVYVESKGEATPIPGTVVNNFKLVEFIPGSVRKETITQ